MPGGAHMNVYDVAMVKEMEVKAYYESLADESALPGVRHIFTLLAADEQRHYDVIRELKERPATGKVEDTPILEAAREVLVGYFGDPAPAAKMKNCLESYRKALFVEAESIRFYEGLLEQADDRAMKGMFAKIMEQERQHYSIVENLYEYVLRPEYYLEWAEFSNLRPL